jgi:hypothetical protein
MTIILTRWKSQVRIPRRPLDLRQIPDDLQLSFRLQTLKKECHGVRWTSNRLISRTCSLPVDDVLVTKTSMTD